MPTNGPKNGLPNSPTNSQQIHLKWVTNSATNITNRPSNMPQNSPQIGYKIRHKIGPQIPTNYRYYRVTLPYRHLVICIRLIIEDLRHFYGFSLFFCQFQVIIQDCSTNTLGSQKPPRKQGGAPCDSWVYRRRQIIFGGYVVTGELIIQLVHTTSRIMGLQLTM